MELKESGRRIEGLPGEITARSLGAGAGLLVNRCGWELLATDVEPAQEPGCLLSHAGVETRLSLAFSRSLVQIPAG